MGERLDFPLIEPDWPAPPAVRAYSTTRRGGVSAEPFDSLNLGHRVDDEPARVVANRARLAEVLELPGDPAWLHQAHTTVVVPASEARPALPADASFTQFTGEVCVALSADCLPVVLCNRQGSEVAAAHAGWRGLADGVIESTVAALQAEPGDLMAWLGPAIGPSVFEVGDEVLERFVSEETAAREAFVPSPAGRWLADLYLLARQRLARAGVTSVYGGGHCTYTERKDFFSYRRDGPTGRMATLIWLER